MKIVTIDIIREHHLQMFMGGGDRTEPPYL